MEKELHANEMENKTSEYKSTSEYLFQEIADWLVGNFVATYKKEDCTLWMRLPDGKNFKITVQDA